MHRWRGVAVAVFDDHNHRLLAKVVTDDHGEYSFSRRWTGKVRIVFAEPILLTEDFAVATAYGPVGGFFRPRKLDVVLQVEGGDKMPYCPPIYSQPLFWFLGRR